MNTKKVIKIAGIIYAVMFVLIVALNYIPAIHDENGLMFGLFHLDPIDDLLHLASGIWAGVAVWKSFGATVKYFRYFGIIYFADGLLGMIIGKNYLNLHVFTTQPAFEGIVTRFFVNLPHLVIGGVALILGWYVARSFSAKRKSA